ncbi:MAG: class IV adenylate cyclase [Cyclonatronaceae bacterium]
MSIRNIEIKARCRDHEHIRRVLMENRADYKGLDQQTDTYYRVGSGRLKLREGRIENNLIHYHRQDSTGPKKSAVTLFPLKQDKYGDPGTIHPLKKILADVLGILMVVVKRREIYFIDNIKFHLDTVDGLGRFVEIEAIDTDGAIGEDRLHDQCRRFIRLFDISGEDMVAGSYSDMMAENSGRDG